MDSQVAKTKGSFGQGYSGEKYELVGESHQKGGVFCRAMSWSLDSEDRNTRGFRANVTLVTK